MRVPFSKAARVQVTGAHLRYLDGHLTKPGEHGFWLEAGGAIALGALGGTSANELGSSILAASLTRMRRGSPAPSRPFSRRTASAASKGAGATRIAMSATRLSRRHGIRLTIAPPAGRDAAALRACAHRSADNQQNRIYRKNDTQLTGDKQHSFAKIKIKKVVSGQDAETLELVASVYESVVTVRVHKAPSMEIAEAATVIENIQRDLNIARMNEFAITFD